LNFVLEAENFLDAKSKEKLEKYLACDKKNLKLADGCDQDETDIPQNVDEVIKDIEDLLNMWREKEEECFKQCSKRKIQSVCNVAHTLMDATSVQKMKKINPSKYRFLKNILKSHKKSLEKLVNSKVGIHEKRKTLQKPQVGEGILHTAANLIIPLLNQILKE
jgi:DNA integrity scanning protein DisA with diadenylate cyclase activity